MQSLQSAKNKVVTSVYDTAVEMGQLWLTTHTQLTRRYGYKWSRWKGLLGETFDQQREEEVSANLAKLHFWPDEGHM